MIENIVFNKCTSKDVSTLSKFLGEEKQDEFITFISESIDWNLVFSAIKTYEHHYNEAMVRMMKSSLISKCIEKYSHMKLKFVDAIGHDFIVPWDNKEIKVEFKHGKELFQTDKSDFTKKIKLDNTNGRSSYNKIYEKTFDYLLLIDVNKAAIVSYEKILPYIINDGDGRSVRIHKKELTIFKECEFHKNLSPIYLDDDFDIFVNKMLEKLEKAYYNR